MPSAAFWDGRTVLVTGATGFLGGWVVRRLLDYQCRVVALVRRPRPESQFYLEGFDRLVLIESGSADDAATIDSIMDRHPIEAVFHIAAFCDVTKVIDNPVECFRSTIQSTWNILESVRCKNPECVVVVSSSDKAYGVQEMPLRETQRLNPLHAYDTAKASQDHIAQTYGQAYGLAVAVTRCGNYFGGYDFTFSRIIPGTIRSVVSGERPVLRSDGHFTRDFLHIDDAVDVQLLMAEQLINGARIRGEPFNFSYGVELEVIEIVHRILQIMKSDLKPIVRDEVQSELRFLSLSTEKARAVLGWEPELGFDAGLERTVEWYTDYFAEPPAT